VELAKSLKYRDLLGYIGIVRRIILKLNLKEQDATACSGFA
jgi:hypothetical protein